MRIEVFPDIGELSRAAGDLFIEISESSAAANGRFSVALSGGNTPRLVYNYLATAENKRRIPWDNTFIFWGDERCVGYDDPANNARNAYDQLLNNVPINPDHIFRIQSELPPEEAAKVYERALAEYFGDEPSRFDLILLGLGENGHTASLFPGTPVLGEKGKWVSSVFVAEQDMYRITLTTEIINLARNIVFLVSGSNKASVLREVIEGEFTPERLPAQLIKPADGNLYWFLDKDAAGMLTNAG